MHSFFEWKMVFFFNNNSEQGLSKRELKTVVFSVCMINSRECISCCCCYFLGYAELKSCQFVNRHIYELARQKGKKRWEEKKNRMKKKNKIQIWKKKKWRERKKKIWLIDIRLHAYWILLDLCVNVVCCWLVLTATVCLHLGLCVNFFRCFFFFLLFYLINFHFWMDFFPFFDRL